MEEDLEPITKIGYIKRKQDYAKELFELSRSPMKEDIDEMERELSTIVERAWCGDLALYITELENENLRISNKKENKKCLERKRCTKQHPR